MTQQRAAYQKYLRAYHALAQANAHMDDKSTHQQNWLHLHYALIKEKLAKTGQKARLQLEAKLAKIGSELAVLKGHLAE